MANQQRYSLLTYDKPPMPYIVLDLYNKEANSLRGCFVIKRAKDNLKIVECFNIRAEGRTVILDCQTYRYLVIILDCICTTAHTT